MTWYAIYTASGREFHSRDQLRSLNVPAECPGVQIRRRKHIGRNQYRLVADFVPLFTSYLFADLEYQHFPIVSDELGSTVVGFGGSPLSIPFAIIEEIMARESPDCSPRPGDICEFTDELLVERLIGQIQAVNSKRVKVWVESVQRLMDIKIHNIEGLSRGSQCLVAASVG